MMSIRKTETELHCILACDIFSKDCFIHAGTQEWESLESIQFLTETIKRLGSSVEITEKPSELVNKLSILTEDVRKKTVVWNLVEGYESRNRESYIPAICEYLGVAHTGSDSYAQSFCLDKNLAKEKAKSLGIPIASNLGIFRVDSFKKDQTLNQNQSMAISQFWYQKGNDHSAKIWFAKPNGEGSGLGVGKFSILKQEKDLEFYLENYPNSLGDILIEEFLPGNEYSVALLQTDNHWLVNSAVISYPDIVYGEEVKTKDSMPETFEMEFDLAKKQVIEKMSLDFARAIGIEGYARIDFRDDKEGNANFMEANLTPGLSSIYSLLPKMFEVGSMISYDLLVQKIIITAKENFANNPRYNYGKRFNIYK